MNIVKTDYHGKERYITVVKNIPLYRSAIHEPDSDQTWYFFAGVFESKYHNHHSGSFIRPRRPRSESYDEYLEKHFGSLTFRVIKEYNLDKDNTLYRFGDLPKMCLSASLGGGFWDTQRGQFLNLFLRLHYRVYFDDDIRLKNKELKKLSQTISLSEMNDWLKNEGVDFAGTTKIQKKLIHIHDHVHRHDYYETDNRLTPCNIL